MLVGLVGAMHVYCGPETVQLTEMAKRVWKHTAEYGLILDGRRRLGK
jgi:hypothetical protein